MAGMSSSTTALSTSVTLTSFTLTSISEIHHVLSSLHSQTGNFDITPFLFFLLCSLLSDFFYMCAISCEGATLLWLSHSTWPWVGPPQVLLELERLRPLRILAEPWEWWSTSSTVLNRWTTRCDLYINRTINTVLFLMIDLPHASNINIT